MVLDSELEIRNRPFNKRFAFWDLFYKLNKRYQVGYGYVPQYGDDGSNSIILSGSVFNIIIAVYLLFNVNYLL